MNILIEVHTEEETQLSTKIRFIGIDHVWDGYRHKYTHQCLNGSGYSDGLRPEFHSRCFANDDEADRTNGQIVDAVPNYLFNSISAQRR